MTRLLALVLAALAGCEAPRPVVVPGPDGTGDTCGLSALAGLVGQPAGVLDAMRFAQPVRVIRPGDAMTEDFSPQRLNIRVDGRERIEALTCG